MTTERQSGLTLVHRPREVEASLWRRFKFEDQGQCRELLFDLHLAFAKAIARREYHRRPPQGLEREDFEQLAMSGLLEAIDRFDPLLGAPFLSFAKHRIRGAIADAATRSSESAATHSFRRRLEIERLKSLAAERDAISADPIADLAEVAVGLAIGLIAERVGASEGPNNPYETEAWRELERRLAAEIALLGEPQRSIIIQHYTHGVVFTEIAALLRLSKGRISQLHRAAITHIRRRLSRSD
ncbi:MAG: sigma-70 family RNA polymerase sigma factor [Vitreimonas sp.]